MTRRVMRFTAAVLALGIALFFAPEAYAQSIDDKSNDLGLSFVAPDIQPSSDPAEAVGGTGGGDAELAVTGIEAEPLAGISIALLAVGGSVLVTSRRRMRKATI